MAKKKEDTKPKVFKVEIEITHRKSFYVLATNSEAAEAAVELRHDTMDPCDDEGEIVQIVGCEHEHEINT